LKRYVLKCEPECTEPFAALRKVSGLRDLNNEKPPTRRLASWGVSRFQWFRGMPPAAPP